MSNYANDVDWTQDEGFNPPQDGGATATAAPVGFFIPEFDADTDAEKIEREAADNQFQDPPIGTHTFVVTGFREDPKRVAKSGYLLDGRPVDYSVGVVRVKLSVAGQKNLTISDYVEFPMGSRHDIECFQKASKAPGGKGAGFMYKKFIQFLKRLGYAVALGEPVPADARNLNDWVGKEVIATVKMGKKQIDQATGRPKCNPSTGEEYAARAEIELFSYREAESTIRAQADRAEVATVAVAPAGGPKPPMRPQGAGAPIERPTPRTQAEFVQSGLNNL